MNYQDSMQAKRSVCNPENWVTNIPQELRDRPQWCVAGEDKAPRIAAHGLPFAKSNDPATWRTFDEASAFAAHYGMHIGYMLHESDEYTCIDLDVFIMTRKVRFVNTQDT